ncbi:hypothetical protein J2S13_001739 [Oikeobacillus pervagus]|uniref:Uncharacterized protein n=1 Tax=Oikeobacillus pervagus TaxID=1325931 RepID=A0AAJ1WKN8_9BACI|nr:hypothetical protein [Oikeobacillus pervagus]MDQ0215326.1 hypothetical protein [Oikeobacillus pervagus]
MVVENLLETKNYFVGETKDNYLVIYEKLQCSDAVFNGNQFEEYEGETAEYVKVLEDPGAECSLKSIKSYAVGKDFPCLEEILASIKESHQEIFK